MKRVHESKAFILIELLVVIAILAALLLPSLQRAKKRAHAAVCASNERQVALSILLYTEDFIAYPSGYWNWGCQYRWHQPVIEGGYIKATLHNYPPSHILHCPSDPGRNDPSTMTYRLSGVAYGTPPDPNARYMTGVNSHRAGEVTRPALSFMLMESSYGSSRENGYDANYPFHPAWDPLQLKVGVAHDGSNVIFCDGHVEFLTRDYRSDIPGLHPCLSTTIAVRARPTSGASSTTRSTLSTGRTWPLGLFLRSANGRTTDMPPTETAFRLACDAPKSPMVTKTVEILTRALRERAGVGVSDAPSRGSTAADLRLAIQSGIGKEGFRIEAAQDGRGWLVTGNDERGLLYGVGKFLRGCQFDQTVRYNGWTGTSVPKLPVRGM